MKHIVFRLIFAIVLIAAIAGIGVLAYNAGITRGEALSAAAPATTANSPAYPAYPYWWPFPFFGFGFFGILALFFLIFIVFGAARRMVWGPRFGGHWMHRRYGPWGETGSEEGIPPMFAEMHRRMHEAEDKKSENKPS